MLSKLLLPFLLIVIGPGAVLAQSAGASGGSRVGVDAGADVWRLRPGDAVRLQVGDEPGLSGQFPVTEDGIVLFPLLGAVPVAGRPFPDVRTEILEAYAAKLVGAPVVATPVIRVAVLGEVRAPGLVPVDPTFTIAHLLAAAGGVTPLGNPSRITLTGDRGSVRFSLTDDEDVLARALHPGDQIVVPRRSWVRENLNVLIGAGASVLAAAVTTLIIQSGQ